MYAGFFGSNVFPTITFLFWTCFHIGVHVSCFTSHHCSAVLIPFLCIACSLYPFLSCCPYTFNSDELCLYIHFYLVFNEDYLTTYPASSSRRLRHRERKVNVHYRSKIFTIYGNRSFKFTKSVYSAHALVWDFVVQRLQSCSLSSKQVRDIRSLELTRLTARIKDS